MDNNVRAIITLYNSQTQLISSQFQFIRVDELGAGNNSAVCVGELRLEQVCAAKTI